jgi:hypothetical protein
MCFPSIVRRAPTSSPSVSSLRDQHRLTRTETTNNEIGGHPVAKRTRGSKVATSLRSPTENEIAKVARGYRLHVVAVEHLREIDPKAALTRGGLKPNEVIVVAFARSPRPVPKEPSDLAWELWRLHEHHGWSFGRLARAKVFSRHLAPKSKSTDGGLASRTTIAKRLVQQVREFLKTPIGRIRSESEYFAEWIRTGEDPRRLRIVQMPDWTTSEAAQVWPEPMADYNDLRAKNRRR